MKAYLLLLAVGEKFMIKVQSWYKIVIMNKPRFNFNIVFVSSKFFFLGIYFNRC